MNWIVSALLAILGLASYNFVLKITSTKISVFYGIPLIGLGVLMSSLLGLVFIKLTNTNNLLFTKNGLLMALLTGFLWGIGEIFFFLMFSLKAPLSVGLPLVVGSISILGALAGVIFLGESLTALKAFAILIISLGLILLNIKG